MHRHWGRWAIAAGAAALALALAGAGWAAARPLAQTPDAQLAPLHPTFALLDAAGQNVLASSGPVSARQTCGQCHDTAFIEEHNGHAGRAEPGAARAWTGASEIAGAWDPLSYTYSPADAPAQEASLDADCFLCHLKSPDKAARLAALAAGQAEWASTAALSATGLVAAGGTGWTWNAEAFDAAGALKPEYVTVQDPATANCAQCHTEAHAGAGPVTASTCEPSAAQASTTGQVFAAERMSQSGVNLAGKAALTRPWDAHAARGLRCTDCHYALNNPARAGAARADSLEHLTYDPRGLDLGQYLQRPNHVLALSSGAPEGLQRCEACHDTAAAHTSLPYEERHLSALACETCHTPQLYAPAIQAYDWTVLTVDGQPRVECRGVEAAGGAGGLVTGYEPALLPRDGAGAEYSAGAIAPYNLVTAWYWVYTAAQGQTRPVPLADLEAALFTGSSYAPEVLAALDADADGDLSASERVLDTPEKQAVVAARLGARGLTEARIAGAVMPYAISHGTASGEWATAQCAACHAADSRLAQPILLASALPGGIMPEFLSAGGAADSGEAYTGTDGALYYQPSTAQAGVYVFGHDRVGWIDGLGLLAFVGVLAGVTAHGGLRFFLSLRQPRHAPQLKRVYMYAVYERFWHWLQTATIVLLLFTGLIIHRPDVFGVFSFRHVVVVHNVLAAILVINAALALFYHLASGEIRQYLPRPYGFFDQAIVQAKFYLRGIFRREPHPFEKTPQKKLNPLQQMTYFGILNVLLPLQVLTGALMWGAQRWPQLAEPLGGLAVLAPVHSLVAWLFAAFIVAHVYLTTTGHTALAGIRAMMDGWDEVVAADLEADETDWALAGQRPAAAQTEAGETREVEGNDDNDTGATATREAAPRGVAPSAAD